MATVTYKKRVSDGNVRTIMQRSANLLDRDITVHSGDRPVSQRVRGSKPTSLHVAMRAADFHISGLSDKAGFAFLKQNYNEIFDANEAYEVIHHGPHTETEGEHLHVGRYGNGRSGYVKFKAEGLGPTTKGNYNDVGSETKRFTNSKNAPIPASVSSGVTVDASIMSPTVGVYKRVGIGGINNYNDVTLVQSLINKALPRLREAKIPFENFNPLIEDGDCGRLTKNAITIFQRDVLDFTPPDGSIDPGGVTIRSLYLAAYGDPSKIRRRVKRVRQTPPVHTPKGVSTGSGVRAIDLAAALKLLKDYSQIRAMLETIAYAEGTRRDRPGGKEYGTIVKGTVIKAPYNSDWIGKRSENFTITNFSRHPEVLVRWAEGRDPSSACGRYQFLKKTWEWMAGYGLGDFSPTSQDLACVMLMQYRGMVAPLLSGNFDQAVYSGSGEWMSLPKPSGGSAAAGQHALRLETLRQVYKAALGS